MTRRQALRGAKAGLLLLVVAAGVVAALFLLESDVPNGLRLPEIDESRYFSERELERTARYERFLRWNTIGSQLTLLVVLGLYAWRGARFARESAAGRIGTGMLLGMLGLAIAWLVQIPFGVAELWWQRRYGLWREGYGEWLLENWVVLGVEFLFICLWLLVTMALARPLRDRWWIGAAPFFVGLALLFAFIFPYLVPDTQRPDRRLATDARRLAAQQHVEDIEVVVEEVGDLTTAPNAGAAGLGPSRKVIVWDTLLDGRFDRDEIRVVLAHEFAHHSRNHVWEGLGWYALFSVPVLFVVASVARRRGGLYQPRAVPLALFVLVAVELAATPLENAVSRRMEAEADWVALESTRDPDAARALFRNFTKTALQQPDPPGWAHVLLDTHPSTAERIAMATAWEARGR